MADALIAAADAAPSLRRPSHGYGALRNFQPGKSGNPGGMPAKTREALRAIREWASTRGIERLKELAESDDERVAAMVTPAMFERAFGRAKEYDPAQDRPPMQIDLTKVPDHDLAALGRIVNSGALRAAQPASPAIEDSVSPTGS